MTEHAFHPSTQKVLSRNLYLTTDVDAASMATLSKSLIEINKEDDVLEQLAKNSAYEEAEGVTKAASPSTKPFVRQPIKIYIDSYGGWVYQCFGLIGLIKSSKTPVYTIVTGCAMSCAFMILISGHKRFGYKYATPMYHQVSNTVRGKIKDIKDDTVETDRLQKIIEDMTVEQTKIKRKKLKEIYDMKIDWYMDVNEALELGVIDAIIEDEIR